MNLDPTLIGVIIGSSLTFLGGILSAIVTHVLTMRKEEKQWQREQQREEKSRKIEEEKQTKVSALEAYHKCISNLLLLKIAIENELEISLDEKMQLYKDTSSWLSLLLLHLSKEQPENEESLLRAVEEFSLSPDSFEVDSTLKKVRASFISDPLLSPNRPPKKEKNMNERKIQVDIELDFRKQNIIKGKEVPPHYIFDCDITILKPSQREKLWNAHNNRIPESIHLHIPAYNEKTKTIMPWAVPWRANLDPTALASKEIFDAWEKIYQETMNSLAQTKEQQATGSSTQKLRWTPLSRQLEGEK